MIPLRSLYVGSRRVLISPVGGAAEHAILPTVEALVAPSLLHHTHLCEAQRLAPYAAVWEPPGFAAKEPELGEVNVLGRDPWPFSDELDFEVIEGAPKRNEVVFFDRARARVAVRPQRDGARRHRRDRRQGAAAPRASRARPAACGLVRSARGLVRYDRAELEHAANARDQ